MVGKSEMRKTRGQGYEEEGGTGPGLSKKLKEVLSSALLNFLL